MTAQIPLFKEFFKEEHPARKKVPVDRVGLADVQLERLIAYRR